jgi:hypothetical protein
VTESGQALETTRRGLAPVTGSDREGDGRKEGGGKWGATQAEEGRGKEIRGRVACYLELVDPGHPPAFGRMGTDTASYWEVCC